MCWLFPCTPILGVSFRLESVKKKKKCVCVINLKNAMLPMRSVFINVKKGISKLGCWLAAFLFHYYCYCYYYYHFVKSHCIFMTKGKTN